MRRILILLALTCAPAFCQDDALSRQLGTNLRRNMGHFFSPQAAPNRIFHLPAIQQPMKIAVLREQVCAIPLLNAKPARFPAVVTPQGAPGASGPDAELQVFDRMAVKPPRIVDHMAVKPPAPACPAR